MCVCAAGINVCVCVMPQFVCVESLVTAMVDMHPSLFRRKNRRELLILVVAVVSFLVGLIMLTEVMDYC